MFTASYKKKWEGVYSQFQTIVNLKQPLMLYFALSSKIGLKFVFCYTQVHVTFDESVKYSTSGSFKLTIV